jgi:hypothetical protein
MAIPQRIAAFEQDSGPAPRPVATASEEAAEFAAQFIPAGARVLELGCGRMALQRFLPNTCHYQGCDLVARDANTIVCDLNAGEFPTQAAADADIIVMLGTLEQIADVETFFTHLRFCRHDLLVSYCATDLAGDSDRAGLGFLNHLSFYDLAVLFDRYGFRIECSAPIGTVQVLMRLTPTERLMPVAPCSVAVVSCSDAGTFGDRLGYHMINSLLPGEADVHHLTFATIEQARAQYDLVVLGTGNGLFAPLMDDAVLDIVGRGKAAIGIFGTQHRELIPRPALDRLLERLDTWFARNEDDVLIYGRGRNNVVHLGDWLIDQFPIGRATLDEPLLIREDIGIERPLDRAIQLIQRHRSVYSTRLHPLLCALTAADIVAYAESADGGPDPIASGEFRSLLIDIFGRSYPEKEFFMVDRDAVIRYKACVHRNVTQVGERIEALLRNVAAAAG